MFTMFTVIVKHVSILLSSTKKQTWLNEMSLVLQVELGEKLGYHQSLWDALYGNHECAEFCAYL